MTNFSEFKEFISNFGECSWIIAAVNAPIEQVSKEFANLMGKELIEDVKFESPGKHDEVGQFKTIQQLKNCKWSIILYCFVVWEDFTENAKNLSKTLNTTVLLYDVEDSSGTEAIKLYDKGRYKKGILTKEQSEYITQLMQEINTNDSNTQEQAKAEETENNSLQIIDSYEMIFKKLKIQLLGIYPKQDGTIAINPEKVSSIYKVNLIKYF